MPQPHVYEDIYGVGILDDIHNYFPALLYEHGRFQNLTQVFHYVRNQMDTRFNLYSYGASRVASSAQAEAEPFAPRITIPILTQVQQHTQTNTQTQQQARTQSHTILVDLLSSFLEPDRGLPQAAWTSFRQPVVVRPSIEMIQQATQIVSGTSIPSDTNCAICQDRILSTDTARKINSCNHLYHQHCIDRWFLRSVYCPTCRQDIREERRIPLLPSYPNDERIPES